MTGKRVTWGPAFEHLLVQLMQLSPKVWSISSQINSWRLCLLSGGVYEGGEKKLRTFSSRSWAWFKASLGSYHYYHHHFHHRHHQSHNHHHYELRGKLAGELEILSVNFGNSWLTVAWIDNYDAADEIYTYVWCTAFVSIYVFFAPEPSCHVTGFCCWTIEQISGPACNLQGMPAFGYCQEIRILLHGNTNFSASKYCSDCCKLVCIRSYQQGMSTQSDIAKKKTLL